MTNIPLIVHLGDGCVIVGKLVTFEQTLLMPPLPGCPIIKLPEASCRVSILTNTMGILDLNARHIVKIGTDKDHMVEIKAAIAVVLYLTSLLNLKIKAGSSTEQHLKDVCNG